MTIKELSRKCVAKTLENVFVAKGMVVLGVTNAYQAFMDIRIVCHATAQWQEVFHPFATQLEDVIV